MEAYEDPAAFVVDVDTTNAIEIAAVDPGEYELQCIKAEGKKGTDKNEEEWKGISMLFDIPSIMTAGLVNFMLFLPRKTEKTNDKQYAQSISRFNEFKMAFKFEPSETFTPIDLVGREVWATLIQEEHPEYGIQNKIQKWIVSH